MTTDDPVSLPAVSFLRSLGAAELPHPGGTLLAHLERVRRQLADWGARPELQLAGLCHAAYGTDGFPAVLLPLDRRSDLAAAIGPEAERIVHRYASCDRRATYPELPGPCAAFHDRFTGRTCTPDPPELRDFAELTAANELDLARSDPAFRERWGADLLALFTRLRPLLSPAAWEACQAVLGAGATPAPAPLAAPAPDAGTRLRPAATAASPGPDAPRGTVAVLGPGGVGGLLAALLARAGHRVVCLAGEATAEALRRDGIRVRSAQFGEFTATVEADTELREPVGLCLVTVKHTHLAQALERVPPSLVADGLVVPLLNGVEHPARLRGRFGADRVAAAVVRVESARVAPGVVEHGSPFTEIDLAGPAERLAPVARLLGGAGVRIRLSEDEPAVLWAKFAFLAPFALLTTRYGLPIGGVRTEHRAELETLVAEAAAVARACGVLTDPAKSLALYDAFPPTAKSSMQRDAEAGRPLELDAIGGALLRAADRHVVPVPLATRLMRELG